MAVVPLMTEVSHHGTEAYLTRTPLSYPQMLIPPSVTWGHWGASQLPRDLLEELLLKHRPCPKHS